MSKGARPLDRSVGYCGIHEVAVAELFGITGQGVHGNRRSRAAVARGPEQRPQLVAEQPGRRRLRVGGERCSR